MNKRFPETQLNLILRQMETGTPVTEVCRKMGVSVVSFYRWRRRYEGMGVAGLRRVRELEEENRKLKKLVADLALEKHTLQEALAEMGLISRIQAEINKGSSL